MNQTSRRFRVDSSGCLEIIDPCFDDLPLLQAIDGTFTIRREELLGFERPRIHACRSTAVQAARCDLQRMGVSALWGLHKQAMSQFRSGPAPASRDPALPSLLELKTEIAWRLLASCNLCARNCGVDRTAGHRGVCGLGTEAEVISARPHIAEEPPINPSMLISLAGCGLRCKYCQQHPLLDPEHAGGTPLGPEYWKLIEPDGCRSLSFIGGNPDESLYAILRFLETVPRDWALPIVWNHHGYSLSQTLDLLEGIVDVYIPDLKFGNDTCARQLAGVSEYTKHLTEALSTVLTQGVPVIVRILALPGHNECCHLPSLERLATYKENPRLFVSLRDQYHPDYQVAPGGKNLGRRVTSDEIAPVREYARVLGLRTIG